MGITRGGNYLTEQHDKLEAQAAEFRKLSATFVHLWNNGSLAVGIVPKMQAVKAEMDATMSAIIEECEGAIAEG